MMRGMCFLALGLVWAPDSARAQEKFNIKIKEGSTGERQSVDRRRTMKSSMKLLDGQGNPLRATDEDEVERLVFEETIVDKPEGLKSPTHLRRRYEAAQVKNGTATRTLAYQGKTVDIQKKDDRYHFRIEGGEELTGKDAESLDKEFNKSQGDEFDFNKAIVPKKAVRVLESWTMDTPALVANLQKTIPVDFDAANAKSIATLVKAYKKDGHQFGVIKLKMVFPLKTLKMGEVRIPFAEGARLTVEATLDGCIDGSLLDGDGVFTGFMEGQAAFDQGGNKFKMMVGLKLVEEEKSKELGKE